MGNKQNVWNSKKDRFELVDDLEKGIADELDRQKTPRMIRFMQWLFCKINQPILSPSLGGVCAYCKKSHLTQRAADAPMWRCKTCGAENSHDNANCSACGKSGRR